MLAMLINQGVVVIRTIDGQVIGLNVEDGKRLWNYASNVPVLSLRGNSPPVFDKQAVILGLDDGNLIALDLDNGQALWKQRMVISHGRSELERMVDIDATPKIADGVIYAVSFQGQMAAITVDSGTILWTRDMSSNIGLDVDHNQVYVVDNSSTIWALDRYNGASVWKQDKLKYRQLTPPTVYGDYIVVGDFEGYLHWLARDDGRLVARIKMDKKGISAAAIVDETTLFVLGHSGILMALQLDI